MTSCPTLVGESSKWKEVLCPICMEHPHNAVLLLCSSFKNGCRPYMCNTSSLHSNCYDQYLKSASIPSDSNEGGEDQSKLLCPLCRGLISGFTVEAPAQKFMNSFPRDCSLELCSYNGAYDELRKHAEEEHPNSRPTEVDPDRQFAWQWMEQQDNIRELLHLFDLSFSGYEVEDEAESVGDGITGAVPTSVYVAIELIGELRPSAVPAPTVEVTFERISGMPSPAVRLVREIFGDDSDESGNSNGYSISPDENSPDFRQPTSRYRRQRRVRWNEVFSSSEFGGPADASQSRSVDIADIPDDDDGFSNTSASPGRTAIWDELVSNSDFDGPAGSDHSDNEISSSRSQPRPIVLSDEGSHDSDAVGIRSSNTGAADTSGSRRRRRVQWGEIFDESEFGGGPPSNASSSNGDEGGGPPSNASSSNGDEDGGGPGPARRRRKVRWTETFSDAE